MALSREIIEATVAAAHEHNMNPAALLAVVEIESGGRPYEADGKTPRFLFERHKFYSELDTRAGDEDLEDAVSKGLAHKDWRRTTQYADQGKSADRLALLERASEVNQECAYRACSWGLGQTMGFHAERLGYPNAVAMVEAMKAGGVRVQIECMIKEIKRNRLEVHLAKRDWARFARGYNGPRYEENDYDGKLARAYARWAPAYAPQGRATVADDVLEMGESGSAVKAAQERLLSLGYAVGKVDGIFGSRTRAAVLAFQAENDQTPDGMIGPATRALMNRADAKPMPQREEITKGDLKAAGDPTLVATDAVKSAVKTGGTLSTVAIVADQTGILDWGGSLLNDLNQFQGVASGLAAILTWSLAHWFYFVPLVCYLLYRWASTVEGQAVLKQRLGLDLSFGEVAADDAKG